MSECDYFRCGKEGAPAEGTTLVLCPVHDAELTEIIKAGDARSTLRFWVRCNRDPLAREACERNAAKLAAVVPGGAEPEEGT